MLDFLFSNLLTNAGLAAAVVPFLQALRKWKYLPVRFLRIGSALAAAVLAAGITYTFNADTGDVTFNLYAVLNAIPLFVVEFAKQFGLQEGFYRVLRQLFEKPAKGKP